MPSVPTKRATVYKIRAHRARTWHLTETKPANSFAVCQSYCNEWIAPYTRFEFDGDLSGVCPMCAQKHGARR